MLEEKEGFVRTNIRLYYAGSMMSIVRYRTVMLTYVFVALALPWLALPWLAPGIGSAWVGVTCCFASVEGVVRCTSNGVWRGFWRTAPNQWGDLRLPAFARL